MKRSIILILVCLLTAGVACNKQYDDRIAALKARSEALHKADAETREMLTKEMMNLSGDVDDMLAAMEDRVLNYLDDMVKKVEARILDESSLINLQIKHQSDKLGTDILAWRANLDDFLRRNNEAFSASRILLQDELSKAIAASDYTLTSRIRESMRNLDYLEENFSGYVSRVQKRVDNLKDMEKVYQDSQKAMNDLRWRKEDMLASLDEYEDRIKDIVERNLEDVANRDLCDAVDSMMDLYDTANTLYEESSQYLSDIEDFYSNVPTSNPCFPTPKACLTAARTSRPPWMIWTKAMWKTLLPISRTLSKPPLKAMSPSQISRAATMKPLTICTISWKTPTMSWTLWMRP